MKKSPSAVQIPALATASVSQTSRESLLSPNGSSNGGQKSPHTTPTVPKSARGKDKDKELKKGRKGDDSAGVSPRGVDVDALLSPTASAGGASAKDLQKETYRLLDIVLRGLGLSTNDVSSVIQFAEQRIQESKPEPPTLKQLRAYLTSANALSIKTVRYLDELSATLKIQRAFRGYATRNRMSKLESLYSGVNWSNRLDLFRTLCVDEEAYGKKLEIIVNGYLQPLKDKPLLTSDEMTSIFRNVEILFVFHQVNKLVEFGEYVEGSSHALTTIFRLSEKNEKFKAFLNKRFKQDNLPPLDELLAAPLDRIKEYTKTIKGILRETPEKHPDYSHLNQAFSLTDKIKKQVKEKLAQAKNHDLMRETKRRTQPLPGIEVAVEGRLFIKEGDGNVSEGKHKEKKPRTLLLFSDALMVAKAEKKDSLEMKQWIRFLPSTNIITDNDGFKMAKTTKDKDSKLEIIDSNNTLGPDCVALFFNERILNDDFLIDPGYLRSNEEHDEWLKLIRQQVDKLKISKAMFFGAPIVDVVKRAVAEEVWKPFDLTVPVKKQKTPISDADTLNDLIPPFFRLLSNSIEEDLMVTGLYRVSASDTDIKTLKTLLDSQNLPESIDTFAPHVIADVLKVFLRQLPEPLLTYQVYESVINKLPRYEKGEEGIYATAVKELIQGLPLANFVVTRALARHLYLVEHYARFNLMTSMNLAIVFGPTILAPPVDSIEASLLMPRLYYVVQVLISHYELIFEEDPPEVEGDIGEISTNKPVNIDGSPKSAPKRDEDVEQPINQVLNKVINRGMRARSMSVVVDKAEVEKLYKKMCDSKSGLDVRDRKLLFKTYKNAFTGAEVVDWLLKEHAAKSRTEGLKIGQQIVSAGFIQPVTFIDKVFKDSTDLYTFQEVHAPKLAPGTRQNSLGLETIHEDSKSSVKSSSKSKSESKRGSHANLWTVDAAGERSADDADSSEKTRMRPSKSSSHVNTPSLGNSEEGSREGSRDSVGSKDGMRKSKSTRNISNVVI